MIEPIALVRVDGGETQAFACGECGAVVGSPVQHGSLSVAFKVAGEHCVCPSCGGKRAPHNTECEVCSKASRERMLAEAVARADARFAKARKVTPDEVPMNAWAYDPSERFGNEGYGQLDEMLDAIDEHDEDDRPAFLWLCASNSPRIDADQAVDAMLENACEDQHEEAFEQLVVVDELRAEVTAAVDRWNAKQTTRSYEVDYSTAIVLASADAKAVA